MDLSQITNLNNVAIFALIGSLFAFWRQIQDFLKRLFGFFIRTDTIRSFSDCQSFIEVLLKKGKIIRWGNSAYVTANSNEYIKKYNLFHHFIFRKNNEFIIKYGKTFLYIRGLHYSSNEINITYLFGTFNIKNVLEEAYKNNIEKYKNIESSRKNFFFQEFSGKDDNEHSNSSSFKKLSNDGESPEIGELPSTIFDNYHFLNKYNEYIGIGYEDIGFDYKNVKNDFYYWQKEGLKLKSEIQFWKENKGWFEDRNLPWVRGALLYGIPGSGKSNMILQAAKELDIPITLLHISNMSNNDFDKFWKSIPYGGIVVIEDIDTVFEGRVNIQQVEGLHKQLLTFDKLINTINGLKQSHGRFLIVTTNKLDSLDPAILRAGRLDVKIEVGFLDREGKEFISKNIMKGYEKERKNLVDNSGDITIVEFQNSCIEKCLEIFNGKKL